MQLVEVAKKRGAGIPGVKLFDEGGKRLPDPKHSGHSSRSHPRDYGVSQQDFARMQQVRAERMHRRGEGYVPPKQGTPRVRGPKNPKVFEPPPTPERKAFSALRRDKASYTVPIAVTSGGAVAADRVSPRRDRQLAMAKRDQRRRNPASERAIGAAVAGTGAHLALGYRIKAKGNAAIKASEEAMGPSYHPVKNPRPSKEREAFDRDFNQHKKKHGITQVGDTPKQREWSQKASMQANPEFTRQYPSHLPGAKYKRALGQMSGRRGLAIGTAFAAVPAAVSVGADAARARRKNSMAKRATYGVQEREFSPLRGAELGSGGASLAWGVSRLGMTGPLAQAGARKAGLKGKNAQIDAGLESVRRATGHGSRQVKRIPGIGTALSVVPSRLRPTVAAAGGAALALHAIPTTRTAFHPTRRF